MRAKIPALLFFLLFTVFFTHSLSAQSPYFRKHTLPQQYNTAGISITRQDSRGFVWLGSSKGLFRFNGIEYLHMQHDSSHDEQVTAIYEDVYGKQWIGYKDGEIGIVENDRFIPYSPEEGFPAVPVTGFMEDKNKVLWFSTYGEGLYYILNGRVYNLNTDDGLNDNYVYTLGTDGQGRVWAATDGGIAICTVNNGKKKVSKITTAEGLPDNIVTALYYNRDNTMWIGTESMGVCRYDIAQQRFIQLPGGWKYGSVSTLMPFTDNVWIGTHSGIIEMNIATGAAMPVSSGTPALLARISNITTDTEGNVWIANGSPTVHITNRLFRFLTPPGSGPGNIQALLHDRSGRTWYSTQDDVYRYTDTAGKAVTEHLFNKTKGINVISMYEDPYGMIWLGTFGQGIYCIDPANKGEQHLTQASGLVDNNVLSITGDGNDVWIATLGGVTRLTVTGRSAALRYTCASYTSESGLGSNYIYKVFIDSKKRVWFATDGKGITVLENGKFINYSSKDGLASNVIYSVTEDSKGNIWFSTSNAGIYRFDGKAFTHFTLENGLRELNISSLIGDRYGNILIVSRQGIDVLNTRTGSVFYHGQELGINEIDPSLNAFSVDKENNIWLGTQRGMIKYCTQAAQSQQWPVVRINKLLVFLNETNKDQHRFAYDQNHISFDYIGFWYHDPEEVTYRIKLEGYDREWTLSRNRFITYPNLPPGEYTFMLQASATSNFEGSPIARYSFVITAPFYNTAWFYVLCVLAVAGALYWYIRTRERKLRAAEALKKDKIEFQFETLKSQVNPHFLFNSFNTLIGVIEEDKETAVEYVEKLSDFYRNILLQREKNVIPLREELKMIGDYYFLQQKRYKSNFIMNIDVPVASLTSYIAPLTLQLLVENAVKHNVISRDRPLTVDIYIGNDYIVVRNNLQRKQHPEPSTGMGLGNIINRYRLLGDNEVRIEETITHYTVAIPLLHKAS